MSADQLNPTPTPRTQHRQQGAATPNEIADGVLTVLAGATLNQVADWLGMVTDDLADAIETYRQAGQAALETQAATRDWYQVHVQFPEWSSAEQTAVSSLGPRVQHLQDTHVLKAWWFIRKAPCWRLRMKPSPDVALDDLKISATAVLDELAASGVISGWRRTLYEPETAVFGGPIGIDIAHNLFSSDSSNIIAYLRRSEPTIGRRELSVLLCTALVRAAGQEWFECGDIWHRVTQLRPMPADTTTDQFTGLTEDLRKLLAHDTRPTGALFGADGPLAFAAPWAVAFHQAGQALAVAASQGALEQGTRNILRQHVIFHWNRMGLPANTQAILAHAAKAAIVG